MIVLAWLIMVGGTFFLIAKEGSSGQTPGKKALGVKVLKEATGQPLGFGMTFVRYLCRYLNGLLCGIGWLWPLWDDKSQTFADKLALHRGRERQVSPVGPHGRPQQPMKAPSLPRPGAFMALRYRLKSPEGHRS